MRSQVAPGIEAVGLVVAGRARVDAHREAPAARLGHGRVVPGKPERVSGAGALQLLAGAGGRVDGQNGVGAVGEAQVEAALVGVALEVGNVGRKAEAAELLGIAGVDVAGKAHADVVVGGEVVAAVAEEVAPVGGLPEGGNKHARAPALVGRRKKAKQEAQRRGHVPNHQVERPRHHLLAGNHLHLAGLNVEVRVLQVAGGIAPILAIDDTVGQTLDGRGAHEALPLRRHGIGHLGLLAFEVVGNAAGRVQSVAVLEHGAAFEAVLHAVHAALGLHGVLAVVHNDEGRLEVGGAVIDAGLVVQPGHFLSHVELHRVLGRVLDGALDLPLAARPHLQRVAGANRAVRQAGGVGRQAEALAARQGPGQGIGHGLVRGPGNAGLAGVAHARRGRPHGVAGVERDVAHRGGRGAAGPLAGLGPGQRLRRRGGGRVGVRGGCRPNGFGSRLARLHFLGVLRFRPGRGLGQRRAGQQAGGEQQPQQPQQPAQSVEARGSGYARLVRPENGCGGKARPDGQGIAAVKIVYFWDLLQR